ncbi:MAG: peptide deformylase [Thermoleophilia bacterium]
MAPRPAPWSTPAGLGPAAAPTDAEGCLSIGEISVDVTRPVAIRVEAQDADGQPVVVEAEEFEARVIQHEMDHLDGVLILDRTSKEQRREALRALRAAT